MISKKAFKLVFVLFLLLAAVGCKYEYTGKLLRVQRVWLGYKYDHDNRATMETVKSNKIYRVAGVGDDIYIATARGFQFTTDKGDKWQSPSGDLADAIVTNIYITENEEVYVCSERGLYKKEAGDDYTFTKVNVGADIVATAVFVDNDDCIYVGSKERGLFVSTDGGNTWLNDLGLQIKRDEEENAPIDKVLSTFIPYDVSTHGVNLKDPADPRNPEGVIRIYPYYRGERLSTYVTSIYVHNDVIYVASDDGGISFTPKVAELNSTTWNPSVDILNWETYIAPYFRYHADSRIVRDDRSAETYWTVGTRNITDVKVNNDAIFVATANRGIAVTAFPDNLEQLENTFGEVQELDIYGSKLDLKGNSEYAMNKEGRFEIDPAYAVGIDNQAKKLQRYSWAEYNTSGLSVYTPEGKIPPIPPIGQKLPSNNIRSIKFGSIAREGDRTPYNLIYACTPGGLAVAHYKRDGGGSVVLSSGDIPWSYYHKDPTTLGEKTRANDVYIIKDKEGKDDEYVYVATDGQGLILFKWEKTWMDKIRLSFGVVDSNNKY